MFAAPCRTSTHPAILSHQWLSSRSVVQTERPASEDHDHDSSVGRPALAIAAGLCALGSRSAATNKLLSALRASHLAKPKLAGSRVQRKGLPFAVTGKRDENEEEGDKKEDQKTTQQEQETEEENKEEEDEEWWEDDKEEDSLEAAAGRVKEQSQSFSPDEELIAEATIAEQQRKKEEQEASEPELTVVEVDAKSTSRVEVKEEDDEDYKWWEEEEEEQQEKAQEGTRDSFSQPEVYEAEVLAAESSEEVDVEATSTSRVEEKEEDDKEEESLEDAAGGKKDQSQSFSPDEALIAEVTIEEEQRKKKEEEEASEPELTVVEVDAKSTSRVEVKEEDDEDYEWWKEEEDTSKMANKQAEEQEKAPEVYEAEVLEAESSEEAKPAVESDDGFQGMPSNYMAPDQLKWRQTADREGIDIEILPDESIGDWVGRDVEVESRTDRLVIHIKEQLIFSVVLFGATKPDENYWDIETDKETKRKALLVHLAKMDARTPWPQLYKDLDELKELEAAATDSSEPEVAESSEPITPELMEAFRLWKAEGRPMDELKAVLVDPETGMTEERVDSLLAQMEEEESKPGVKAEAEKEAPAGVQNAVERLALRIVNEALEKANRQLV